MTAFDRYIYLQDGRPRVGRSPSLIRYFEEGARAARLDQPWTTKDSAHLVGSGRTVARWEDR